ncbi:GFA family protein [Aestuariibacter sp. AA17]|uniref:GFA family protein n=1 Tax=Fluctibacter corallii TaxID=2984329 RepID=A0ABT3AB64_9ALTE|nr:GFA family protein [Aestuariibacter sp. AA17]MCV2885915.1 GFA family protein [Aestuariibacter sp. AA17]
MITGSCLCGTVNITIDGEITDIIHCHCSKCRKNSGTAYATNGFINRSEFTVQAGEEALHFYQANERTRRYFCKHCASPVYSENSQDQLRLRIRLGIIDSEIPFRPTSHNFLGSKANWDDLDANLPRYEEFEPKRQQRFSKNNNAV